MSAVLSSPAGPFTSAPERAAREIFLGEIKTLSGVISAPGFPIDRRGNYAFFLFINKRGEKLFLSRVFKNLAGRFILRVFRAATPLPPRAKALVRANRWGFWNDRKGDSSFWLIGDIFAERDARSEHVVYIEYINDQYRCINNIGTRVITGPAYVLMLLFFCSFLFLLLNCEQGIVLYCIRCLDKFSEE